MATKTISLEFAAHEKLQRVKRSDRESFFSVERRANDRPLQRSSNLAVRPYQEGGAP